MLIIYVGSTFKLCLVGSLMQLQDSLTSGQNHSLLKPGTHDQIIRRIFIHFLLVASLISKVKRLLNIWKFSYGWIQHQKWCHLLNYVVCVVCVLSFLSMWSLALAIFFRWKSDVCSQATKIFKPPHQVFVIWKFRIVCQSTILMIKKSANYLSNKTFLLIFWSRVQVLRPYFSLLARHFSLKIKKSDLVILTCA